MLTKIKNTTKGLGSRTMAFFRKGDELEATGYKTLPYDDPTLMPPKLGFRGFDKIPRKRAPLVITVVLIALAALGVSCGVGSQQRRGWCRDLRPRQSVG